MSTTSWQVKAKYNKKKYRTVTVQLDRDLVGLWEEKLQTANIGKSEFIRNAITEYLKKEAD